MKFHKGQVLIELLLAFAVSSVALVSMAQIATKSVSNATYAKNRSEANQYAVQAIEWVRNRRSRVTWSFFHDNYTGVYCLNSDLSGNPSMSAVLTGNNGACPANSSLGGNSVYSRTVTFPSTPVAGQVQIIITVSWPEAIGMQSSTQTIIFKQY